MGILNTTPDSFYDGGKYTSIENALIHCDKLIEDGCDIIDVGGESTRPGSQPISVEDEYSRVIPVIKSIKKKYNVILSVDTTKNVIAREALEHGVELINDISGLKFDPDISKTVAYYNAGIVLNHTTSRPQDMQSNATYKNIIEDVYTYLINSIKFAEESGINESSIIIDPGFGFGKELNHNLLLLRYLNYFKKLNKPIMIGTSMKSFIGKISKCDDIETRREGTIASVAIAIMNSASIVRVHNVKEVKRAVELIDAVKFSN